MRAKVIAVIECEMWVDMNTLSEEINDINDIEDVIDILEVKKIDWLD